MENNLIYLSRLNRTIDAARNSIASLELQISNCFEEKKKYVLIAVLEAEESNLKNLREEYKQCLERIKA
jgi:hypothetical protein